MAVEPLLPTQLVSERRTEALEEILIGTAPGVVDAHRIVGGDWAIEERPRLTAGSLRAEAFKCSLGTPTRQHLVLQADQVRLRINRVEH